MTTGIIMSGRRVWAGSLFVAIDGDTLIGDRYEVAGIRADGTRVPFGLTREAGPKAAEQAGTAVRTALHAMLGGSVSVLNDYLEPCGPTSAAAHPFSLTLMPVAGCEDPAILTGKTITHVEHNGTYLTIHVS